MKITAVGCLGAFPSCSESTSSFLIEANGTNILLDCGSGVLSNVQNYIDLKDLDAVIISHYHADHVSDIYCLQHAIRILKDLNIRDKPLNIYANSKDDKFQTLSYEDCCIAHHIDCSTTLVIGNLRISFMENNHPVYCLSTKVIEVDKCIVYTSDTGWTEELIDFSMGADLFICESSLYRRFYGLIFGHLAAEESAKLAASAGVKRLVLTHLPPYGNHEELLKDAEVFYKGPLELASSGKCWEFK